MILLAPSLSFSCNLHYLKLSFVRIVDERFCKWISCACKCTKEIKLFHINGMESITIEGLSLESFKLASTVLFHLNLCDWTFGTSSKSRSLKIFAPNLRKLRWKGKLLNSQSLGEFMSLEKAQIFLKPEVNGYDNLYEVLCSVCRAKVLILNEETIKVLFTEGSRPGPLDDIRYLGLHLRSLNNELVPAVVSLLRGVPNLNTLNIESGRGRRETNPMLVAVTIKLSDASNEIELARYVVEYAQNLKKMTILCSSFQQPSDVQGKVSKCKMFSTAFVVIQSSV
ncbi:hypothetical protein DVH24_006367 [Malus domestica]|uniref:Uncharacterized protein n=2 Tax=Malus domestica TaxID=3750 RepID=A0A498K9X6_MALDO|nr:hypothetical protein DVH24_006367 [Malus domestica]